MPRRDRLRVSQGGTVSVLAAPCGERDRGVVWLSAFSNRDHVAVAVVVAVLFDQVAASVLVAGTDACAFRAWDTCQVVPTVVIIDDSDDFLASAAGMLNEEGFLVVGCVADPSIAVDEVGRLQPSVVLLDIHMPTTSGFELAVELARMDPRPVVVLISSREATSFGEVLRSAPVRGFIAKRELSGEALATMV